MTTAFLYITLCTAAYYLISRAKITQPLWSRYPAWLDYWTSCAACSGFWYGIGCAALGRALGLPLLGIPPDVWYVWPVAGSLGLVWTPIVSFVMAYSWSALLPPEDDAES